VIEKLNVLTMPETFAELQERLGDVPASVIEPFPRYCYGRRVIEALARPRSEICGIVDGYSWRKT